MLVLPLLFVYNRFVRRQPFLFVYNRFVRRQPFLISRITITKKLRLHIHEDIQQELSFIIYFYAVRPVYSASAFFAGALFPPATLKIIMTANMMTRPQTREMMGFLIRPAIT